MANIVSITIRPEAEGYCVAVVRDDTYQAVTTMDTAPVKDPINALIRFADMVKTEDRKALDEERSARRKALHYINTNTTEAQKLELIEVFEHWAVDTAYKDGEYVQHHGTLYVCRKAHTADYELIPSIAEAYWRKAVKEKPSYPIYDHETTYQIGDRCRFGGKPHIYLSLVRQQGQSPSSSPNTWEDEGEA